MHWRRKDFVRSHAKEIPSIEGAAKQIETALDRLQLTTVFVATDAPDDGYLCVEGVSDQLHACRSRASACRFTR